MIVVGTVPRVIDGAESTPDPWFSMQKYSVWDPPAVIVQGTVFVKGLVFPYEGSPTEGHAVGAAVKVATPIAVP